jgi:hypothetical protein
MKRRAAWFLGLVHQLSSEFILFPPRMNTDNQTEEKHACAVQLEASK